MNANIAFIGSLVGASAPVYGGALLAVDFLSTASPLNDVTFSITRIETLQDPIVSGIGSLEIIGIEVLPGAVTDFLPIAIGATHSSTSIGAHNVLQTFGISTISPSA